AKSSLTSVLPGLVMSGSSSAARAATESMRNVARNAVVFMTFQLLFRTSAHPADLIVTRQAEGEERPRGLRGTDEDNVGQDDVSRTDINATAGYGRPGPHGR